MITAVKVVAVCLCASVAALALTRAYLRVAHPFWARQPVSHYHDILAHWRQGTRIVGSVMDAIPLPGVNLATVSFGTMQDDLAKALCSLHESHYPSSNAYRPQSKCFRDRLLYPGSRSFAVTAGANQDLRGFITGQAVQISAFGHRHVGYLVDNLCVHTSFRKKGVANSLISKTAYEAERRSSDGAAICVFKREGSACPYRPLVMTRGVQIDAGELGEAGGGDLRTTACKASNLTDELEFEEACKNMGDSQLVSCLPPARGWYAHFLGQKGNFIVKCCDGDGRTVGYLCSAVSPMKRHKMPVLAVLAFVPSGLGHCPPTAPIQALVETMRLSESGTAHVELLGALSGAPLPKHESEWSVTYYAHNMNSTTVPPGDFVCLI